MRILQRMSDPFDLTEPAPLDPKNSIASVPPWLTLLNSEQREAVETTEGPVLVLSGAGTGKTRVLTTRLAHILQSNLAKPWQVLAVTFTNRAARQMRDRVTGMIGPVAESVWLGTFHSIGVKILRRHGELAGIKSSFTILDTDDQMRLLKKVMEGENIDLKKWPSAGLLAVIQRWKDRGLTYDRIGMGDAKELYAGRAVELYRLYQNRLLTLNCVDFGDLLLHCLSIFQNHPDILEEYQKRFRYILVDEYQDTNVAQYLWLRLLSQTQRNLCCVGDDDQSIYSWRGAEVGNILRFEKDFEDAVVIRLERNYRSTPNILSVASHLISHNEGRLGKTLRAAGDDEVDAGEAITVRGVWDGAEEARWAVDEIEALQSKGHPLNTIAVLVRASFQTLEFEERLIATGTSYRVIGGPRFYERLEVRDSIAYLRLINLLEDDLAFERVVNKPKRGIGEATLQKIYLLARSDGKSLFGIARDLVDTDDLKPQARRALRTFTDNISRWRTLVDTVAPADLASMVLDESGYTEMWQNARTPDAPGRLDNLREFVVGLEEWETIGAFLEHIGLVMENQSQSNEDAVTLMTLHSAKGLEFDTVFLPGWEEDIFPHRRALDEGGDKSLEEERRLAYVGLTRARQKLLISYAANRRVFNQWQTSIPSRFVSELPDKLVDSFIDFGVYGVGSSPAGEGETGKVVLRTGRGGPSSIPVVDSKNWGVGPGKASLAYKVGDRVFHQKFGYGRIDAIDDSKLEIEFEKAGWKKVMASFVEST